MDELWVGIVAGGGLKLAWNKRDKLWYYPVFCSHDECNKFWHGRTHDRHAWAIRQINIEKA